MLILGIFPPFGSLFFNRTTGKRNLQLNTGSRDRKGCSLLRVQAVGGFSPMITINSRKQYSDF